MKPKGTANNTEQLVKCNPSRTHDNVIGIQQSWTIFSGNHQELWTMSVAGNNLEPSFKQLQPTITVLNMDHCESKLNLAVTDGVVANTAKDFHCKVRPPRKSNDM